MGATDATMELLRWGFVQIPAALYYYAGELDLDAEDIGILGAFLYTYCCRSKPLWQRGLEIGQVMQCYPSLSKSKLAWRLSKWVRLGLVEVEESTLGGEFRTRRVFLEPLWSKLEEMVIRDHPELDSLGWREKELLRQELQAKSQRVHELERLLERGRAGLDQISSTANKELRVVIDFIEQKTGNLVSPEMYKEANRWLDELKCRPEYVIMMLELCFERKIYNPREITAIARGLREASISNLGGMEDYFRRIVDKPGYSRSRRQDFAVEMAELGSFTGIDMQAEARRNMYEKWRVQWGFSHEVIMKAGEIMCQRTRSGGLEYMDRVLANWREKGITTPEEAERETSEFKNRKQKRDSRASAPKTISTAKDKDEVEIFVVPQVLEELKSKVPG
ncbi:MAG: DnaD domain protein [Syntrophothermus sp.]|uniref:DnaD domain protein n=1 Tax=Syntrophothermus sp. TaxID=2736299 RepID=UPI00258040C4|nr:DnaD domain protein [Syntrophothermus sp.]NSW83395.1 DnaD domain protein [Syntrophothermus sp.]